MSIKSFCVAVIVTLTLTLCSLCALAQTPTTTTPTPVKAFGVTLTAAQADQFKAIYTAAQPKMKAIRDNAALSDADKKTQITAIYADIKQQLIAILTPEQVAAMEKTPTPAPTKDQPVTIFGVTLTPAQADQFKAIRATEEPKMKAIRDNATLSEADKKTQMSAVYADMKQQVMAILTPDQLAAMQKATTTPPTKTQPVKVFGVTLTAAQADQFKAICAAEQPKMKAIRDNAALTDADKKTQITAVYADIKQQLIAILTPEQVASMEKTPTPAQK